jgi:GNAT superfamily N-acetyltransferase
VSEPAQQREPAAQARGARDWLVRPAEHGDTAAVAVAVRELVVELGGTPAPVAAMLAAVRELLDSPRDGIVLVADSAEVVVGVLAASWQLAIHVPGRYALIQDLWVERSWRGHAIGAGLLAALVALARRQGCERVEVGLPRPSFSGIAATEAFYRASGFVALGPRMRVVLS